MWLQRTASIFLFHALQPYAPVLYLVGALHRIDVHADLVLDMRGHAHGPGIHVSKDDPSPKLVLLQQMQGLVGHLGLVRVRYKLIQVDTLQQENRDVYTCRYQVCSVKLPHGPWCYDKCV